MKIIGCGNIDRGDDAAGVLVVHRLREQGIEARVATSLFDAWEAGDDVVLVDAMSSGREVGSVVVWEGSDLPEIDTLRTSTHDFGIAPAIRLAKALGRMPARLQVYAIEGRQFGIGSSLSPEVMHAVEVVSMRIATEAAPTANQQVHWNW